MSEDFFRKLSKKEIDALTNVDFQIRAIQIILRVNFFFFFFPILLSSFAP